MRTKLIVATVTIVAAISFYSFTGTNDKGGASIATVSSILAVATAKGF